MSDPDAPLQLEAPKGKKRMRQQKMERQPRLQSKAVGKKQPEVPMKSAEELATLIRGAAAGGLLIFLELFSGVGNVARSASNLGFSSIALDMKEGWDITSPCILAVLLAAISCGLVAAVSLAPPCASWSRARRGKPNGKGYPRKLRSKKEIMGLLSLTMTAKEKKLLQDGTATMRACKKIIRECKGRKIPVALENPHDSLMFWAPELLEECEAESPLMFDGLALEQAKSNVEIQLDMCAFECPYRKPTRLWFWNLSQTDVGPLKKKCKARRTSKGSPAICCFTKKPHEHLTGAVKSAFRTKKAEEYTPAFAASLAQALLGVEA